MDYLVQLQLADSGRSTTPQDGLAFIEQYVLPTLEVCKTLQAGRQILAGGPVAGSIALALVIQADTIEELEDMIPNLPIWPRMITTVTPLTTFDGRIASLRPRLERLRSSVRGKAAGDR